MGEWRLGRVEERRGWRRNGREGTCVGEEMVEEGWRRWVSSGEVGRGGGPGIGGGGREKWRREGGRGGMEEKVHEEGKGGR